MAKDVAQLLASDNASENCRGLGLILAGEASSSEHEDAILLLESNEKRAPLFMTVGELASVVLAVFGIKSYQGDSDRVRHYIAQQTS